MTGIWKADSFDNQPTIPIGLIMPESAETLMVSNSTKSDYSISTWLITILILPDERSRGGRWPRGFMSIKSEFHCVLQVSGSQKVARSFPFLPFNWVWPSSPADRASSGSSHQPATGTATCSCTHRSASECSIFLFVCSRHWNNNSHQKINFCLKD